MRSAASAMACNPEEQKRLMVIALVSTGSPARSEALKARPTGVRTAETMTASGMAGPHNSKLPFNCWSDAWEKATLGGKNPFIYGDPCSVVGAQHAAPLQARLCPQEQLLRLLGAEGLDGIDGRGAARRQVARKERGGY